MIDEKEKYTDGELVEVADFFKVLGDPTRIKIVCLLFEHGELCVSDIVKRVLVSRTAVSHQLRTLKNNHVVSFRKEGQMNYYFLDDEHVEEIINLTMIHLRHQSV